MNCKKCGTENPEESEFCSKCGKRLTAKKKMDSKKKIILIIVLAIIVIGTITALILSKSQIGNTNKEDFKVEIQQEEFTVSNEKLDYASVDGLVTNNTTNVYESVIVSCLLYDEQGNTIGQAKDYIEFLGANQRYKFNATPDNYSDIDFSNVTSFSVEEVKGTKIEDSKNITKDFEIYDIEWGKGNRHTHPDDSTYHGIYIKSSIKNISKNDYTEPFTIIYSVNSKSSGNKLCTYYSTVNNLKPNASTNITTQTPYDYFAYVETKYSSSKGLYFDSIYDISVVAVIQGKLMEE